MKHRKLRIAWSVAWGLVALYFTSLTSQALERKPLSNTAPSTIIGKPPLAWIQYSEDRDDEAKLSISLRFFKFDMWIWEPILPAAALAAVPWLPRRYSLRTLLIGMALVAIMLGSMAWLRPIAPR